MIPDPSSNLEIGSGIIYHGTRSSLSFKKIYDRKRIYLIEDLGLRIFRFSAVNKKRCNLQPASSQTD